ncbi:excisionase family DNA binding protein [Paenibacillus sp. LBL]|uniref:helix-turn-helix domain-containing protein n=1 Tax=unclassified Paenibacillus TaxID=185978 RepID=UPI0024771AE4|nr:helix-turn-helix domain-containing protein [Paenibacillus sp. LBL]MDH6675771.1 excisionase family DNA binding protein [Paenibacillus sp. LBL]
MNASNKELPAILTIQEAATHLRRCTKTVRNRIKAGKLRSFKEGQEHRIRREWLLEYEESLISKSQ